MFTLILWLTIHSVCISVLNKDRPNETVTIAWHLFKVIMKYKWAPFYFLMQSCLVNDLLMYVVKIYLFQSKLHIFSLNQVFQLIQYHVALVNTAHFRSNGLWVDSLYKITHNALEQWCEVYPFITTCSFEHFRLCHIIVQLLCYHFYLFILYHLYQGNLANCVTNL